MSMQFIDALESSSSEAVCSSGLESEFLRRQKVPLYFSLLDNDDNSPNSGDDKTQSILSSPYVTTSNGKSNLTSTKLRSSSSSRSPKKEDYVTPQADVAAGSNSNIGLNVGGCSIGESATSNVMSRVTSIKSMLSVSNLVSLNRESASVLSSPSQSPEYYGGRTDTAARPHTSFVTSVNFTGASSHGFDTIDSILLKDLNLLQLGMDVEQQTAITNESRTVAAVNSINERKEIEPTWRLKERMKTIGVGLILALNIGTDPPDVNKPTPCAKLQCWMDPSSTSRAKARERIGELLEAQYARWQGQQRAKLKVKKSLDPTVEDVRNLCYSLRRAAKNERILLHYNGHGVPRPTANGEIWVFDKNHTQYIPFAISDLRKLIGKPSMMVLDCSGAGALLPFLTEPDENPNQFNMNMGPMLTPAEEPTESSLETDACAITSIRDVIVLCPTSESEQLPMNPDLPADLFTCCLTTPIAIALRWFIRQNRLSCSKIDPDSVEIPGKLNDRKTPLGELNWIFTAITDTIAWNILPTPLFQSLFRQDLMVASMFRNFLLADRILRELNCTPISHPTLPSTCNHPLWQAWDLAVESCITQLVKEGQLKSNRDQHSHPIKSENDDEEIDDSHSCKNSNSSDISSKNAFRKLTGRQVTTNFTASSLMNDNGPMIGNLSRSNNVSAPFFAEQLKAFEIWLEFATVRVKSGGIILNPPQRQHERSSGRQKLSCYMYPGMSQDMESPEQLPVVLQVLLSPAHRVRALVLLRQFLNLGPSAVNLALSVGICPYVLRLLQSPIDEYKHLLVGIWSRILEFDPSCQGDLVKDGALPHFIRHLNWSSQANHLTSSQRKGDNTKQKDSQKGFDEEDKPSYQRTMAAVILSAICRDFPQGQTECLRSDLHSTCAKILESFEQRNASGTLMVDENSSPPMFRMWLCICLGMLCKDNLTAQTETFKAEIHLRLIARLRDECSSVRAAACFALGNMIGTENKKGLVEMVNQPQMLSPSQGQPSLNLHSSLQSSGINNMPWQQQKFIPLQTQQGCLPLQIGLVPQLSAQGAGVPFHSSAISDKSVIRREIQIVNEILYSFDDASPIVRYEAIVLLGRLVQKHLTAFVIVAQTFMKDETEKQLIKYSMPDEVTAEMEIVLNKTWKKIRSSHETDPHPKVAKTTTAILRFVNEKILRDKRHHVGLGKGLTSDSNLAAADRRNSHLTQLQHRTQSAMNLGVECQPTPRKMVSNSVMHIPGLNSISEHGRGQTPKSSLHRSYTAGGSSNHNDTFLFTKDFNSTPRKVVDDPEPKLLLVSKFYEWKKQAFECGHEWSHHIYKLDHLNADDAIDIYREQRNMKIDSYTKALSNRYADLWPVPSKRRSSYYSGGLPTPDFGNFEDNETEEEKATIESELAAKKESLKMTEMAILKNEGPNFPLMLNFHSYDSVLATSDGTRTVSVWNINMSKKTKTINNGNPANSRITSMSWINERNNSLLLTGCDDGSVRIWDKCGNGDQTKAELATSFFAMPELEPGNRRKSGLVTEWQQSEGRIIAGGATKLIRCWDLQSEKCKTTIDSQATSNLTAFATAWDYVHNDEAVGGFSGIGPDILIGGYGDGTMMVFDLRVREKHGGSLTLKENPKILRRGRERVYKEHKSWIVNLSYTHSPSKYEIVSGAIAGDVRWWDLRMKSSSVRNVEIQRSPMTAMACHPRIPVLASGSDANFVKIWTPDGDAVQVIRHHERLQGQRIGRVSSLDFHPNRPLLAAAYTDHYISIYTKQSQ